MIKPEALCPGFLQNGSSGFMPLQQFHKFLKGNKNPRRPKPGARALAVAGSKIRNYL